MRSFIGFGAGAKDDGEAEKKDKRGRAVKQSRAFVENEKGEGASGDWFEEED
jgi:hypothetical protein